jgi:hypothetical protein
LFARIERWSNQADRSDVFWRSISRDNVVTWYGDPPLPFAVEDLFLVLGYEWD